MTSLWGSLFVAAGSEIEVKRSEFDGSHATVVTLDTVAIHLTDEQALVLSQALATVENEIVTPPRTPPPALRPWHTISAAAVAPGDVIWRDGEWVQVTNKLPDFDTVWLTFADASSSRSTSPTRRGKPMGDVDTARRCSMTTDTTTDRLLDAILARAQRAGCDPYAYAAGWLATAIAQHQTLADDLLAQLQDGEDDE